MNLPDRDRYLAMDDAALSTCCTLDFYKATGPGGQHRNKTSTGVRLIFRPLALQICDDSERSQHRNRAAALRKLRLAIARLCREPLPEPCPVYRHLAPDNPEYPAMLALLADALAACGFDHRIAAEKVGLSRTMFLRELARENDFWLDFAARRAELGLPPLSRP